MVSLPEITMFVLCVAFTGLLVLEPVLDILHELSKHHPVTAAAATAATLIVVPTTYLMGVTLVYLQVTMVRPAAFRWFASLACAMASCALLLLVAMPLVHCLFSM
nr:unnamed protein product [Digitaria exilis]CAB3469896.1 unnamed protein product [Digitaria exilis]